jgi:ferredoxin
MNGFDERDTVFSRMELKPGTTRYQEYYAAHPQRQAADDAARAAPSEHPDDPVNRRLVEAGFGLLADLRPLARGPASEHRTDLPPGEATAFLRRLAESHGATWFGVSALKDLCFYTIRGRGAEYGSPVEVPGRLGIVFAVPMSREELAGAPSPRASAEVVNAYLRVALIGLVLARCLRSWGHPAACTMDGRADLVLPLAAWNAGLGAMGRSGLLLTDAHGPRVRLGAVLTSLPLEPTAGPSNRTSRVCASCGRCARFCPARAIDAGPPAEDGRYRPVDHDACFAQWCRTGTDCGLCLVECPYVIR